MRYRLLRKKDETSGGTSYIVERRQPLDSSWVSIGSTLCYDEDTALKHYNNFISGNPNISIIVLHEAEVGG